MQKYHMRRKDRQITDEIELNEILAQGKYATIAMCHENEPYIVTLSYGYDKTKESLYFHTALKGLKIDFLSYNPRVCVTIINDCGYIMGECGHKYRSIVIKGEISFVKTLDEKKYGMKIILDHLEDNPSLIREKKIKSETMYNNIAVLRLNIESLAGKKGQ